MALAHADQSADRFYSMSSQIEAERRNDYLELERQQRCDLDITPWLQWFIGRLDHAITRAEETLVSVIFISRFWGSAKHLLDGFGGKLTTFKYAELAKCSANIELRDIQQPLRRWILFKNESGGRTT